MQHTYKIIMLLSTIFCMPYFAADQYYITGTKHFSIPTPKIPQHSMNALWENTSTGYGLIGGIPISMKIGNTFIQPEIIYNTLSVQAIKKKLIKTPPSDQELQKETPIMLGTQRMSWSFSNIDRVIEETFTQNSYLIGLKIKWNHSIFFKKINTFVAIMPFTGICLARIPGEDDDTSTSMIGKLAPFLIELGIKHVFYKNMFWTLSSKYIHPLKDKLPNHPLCTVEGGFGFSF